MLSKSQTNGQNHKKKLGNKSSSLKADQKAQYSNKNSNNDMLASDKLVSTILNISKQLQTKCRKSKLLTKIQRFLII